MKDIAGEPFFSTCKRNAIDQSRECELLAKGR
jgi:hypothetical protein